MILNHLNLTVAAVDDAARFFEAYLGLRCVEKKGQNAFALLVDDAGFCLILSNFDRSAAPQYPKDFHLGFIQKTKEQVEALHQRLQTGGYASQPPRQMHGSWGFYFTAPGGILIEVSVPVARDEGVSSGQ